MPLELKKTHTMKRKTNRSSQQTLKDLIQQVEWKEVAEELALCFPEKQQNLSDYEQVFHTLNDLDPIPSGAQIVIAFFGTEPDSGESYYVYGKRNPHDGGSTLSFTPWANWLGMGVSTAASLIISKVRKVALCLYDICYYGFSELSIQEEQRAFQEEFGL